MSDHPFEQELARGLAIVIKEFVGEQLAPLRTELVALRGQVKALRETGLHYKGTYEDGAAYEPGDAVTSGGSVWRAREQTTSKPGTDVDAWRLIVRKGRDGKDAANGRAHT